MSDKEEPLDDYLINLDSDVSGISGVSSVSVDETESDSKEGGDGAQSVADAIAAQKAAASQKKADVDAHAAPVSVGNVKVGVEEPDQPAKPDHVVVNIEPKGKEEDADLPVVATDDEAVEMKEVKVSTHVVDITANTTDVLPADLALEVAAELEVAEEGAKQAKSPRKNALAYGGEEAYAEVNNSRARCAWLCCWQIPLINFPLAVVVWVDLVMMILITLMYIFAPNARISFVPITLWGAWVIAVVTSYVIVAAIVAKFVNWVEGNAYRWMKLFYFTNNLQRSLTLALNGLLIWLAWIEILIGIPRTSTTPGWWITRIGLIMFIVFAVKIGVTIAAKILIVSLQKGPFWRKMANLFLRERLVEQLLLPLDEVRLAKIAAKKKSENKKVTEKVLKSTSKLIGLQTEEHKPTSWSFDKVWKQLLHRDPEWRRISVTSVILGERQDLDLKAKVTLAAVACSRRAFRGIDKNEKGFITVEDTTEWLNGDEHTAQSIFKVLDVSKQGAIELEELSDQITEIFVSRENLRRMLKDQENMARILTSLIMTLFWIIMVIVTLIILELDLDALLVPIATMLLTAAFVFGNSMKRVWESFVVVFLMDLFDVGDRIEVKGYPSFIVAELALLTTRGFHPGGRQVTVPNFKMWEQPIMNYGRSRPYRIELHLTICSDTTQAVLDAVGRRMKNWCSTRRSVYKNGTFMFWTDELPTAGHMDLGMYVVLHTNWQKSSTWQIPRSKLLAKFRQILAEFEIQSYGQDMLRVQTSVAAEETEEEKLMKKPRVIGNVKIVIHKASHLDSGGKPADPVIKVEVGDVEGKITDTEFQTKTKLSTNDPVYEEVFTIPVTSRKQGISLQVQNARNGEFTDIGRVFLDIEGLTQKKYERNVKLSKGDGTVSLSLQFLPK